MRQATIKSSFWTGETGRKLKGLGGDVQRVAFYLLTAPTSNEIGLYYLPIVTIGYELGMSEEGALKALARASEGGFCSYDRDSEWVWVPEMAKHQIGPNLKPKDNRVKGVNRLYRELPDNPYLYEFWKKYGEAFHIEAPRHPKKSIQDRTGCVSPDKGASKGLTSPSEGGGPVPDILSNTYNVCNTDLKNTEQEKILDLDMGEEIFLSFPLKDGSEFHITQEQIASFRSLYPAVDIEQSLRNCLGWNQGNPSKRKTRRGFLKHVHAWMLGDQEKASGVGSITHANNGRPVPSAADAVEAAIAERDGTTKKNEGVTVDVTAERH